MKCINKLSDMIDETQIIDILNKYRDKYQGLAESYETKIIESDNDKDENILGYDWINFEQKSSDDYIKMEKSMGSNGNCYICGKHLISLVKFNKLSQELNIDNNDGLLCCNECLEKMINRFKNIEIPKGV